MDFIWYRQEDEPQKAYAKIKTSEQMQKKSSEAFPVVNFCIFSLYFSLLAVAGMGKFTRKNGY